MVTPVHFGVQKVSLMTLNNKHKSHIPCAFLLSVCWREMTLLQIALERAVTPSQLSSVIIGHWKLVKHCLHFPWFSVPPFSHHYQQF